MKPRHDRRSVVAWHLAAWIGLVVATGIWLVACSSGGGGGEEPPGGGGGGGPGGAPVILSTAVTALGGASTDKAIDATLDLAANPGVASTSIEADASGARIARTELEIWFKEGATVGEINALLATHNASVVGMLKGVPFLLIHIPDPGSLAALDAIISQLEASPIVEEVIKSPIPETEALPDNHTDSSNVVDWTHILTIDHHLAIGAHGAWNVKKALERPGVTQPTLLLVDHFGDGPPLADFDIIPDASQYGTTAFRPHGYEVLSVISADFGGDADDRGRVTGLYPGRLTVDAVDLTKTWSGATFESGWAGLELDLLAGVLRRWGGNVVVNASIGLSCSMQAEADVYCSETYIRGAAVRWIRKVRGRGLEVRFILTTSAGNIAPAVTGHHDARYNKSFNAAALIHNLTLADGTPVAPLANTLVVENTISDQTFAPFAPRCLAQSSKWPGNISGIGSYVAVLPNPAIGFNPSASGTSYSAPQVAGLAAYAWALAPTLSNFQIIDLLRNTSRDITVNSGAAPGCGTVQPAPVIDAFTALLGLDAPTRLSGGASAPIRLALLDVNDDRSFDEDDLSEILDAFDNAPELPDYSRYDLNGDGYTGGIGTVRFDLNINASFDTASYQFNGQSVQIDEQAVMDHEVLCYYAHSPLYGGDSTKRDDLLDGRCRFGELKVILGSEQGIQHVLETRTDTGYDWRSELMPDGGLAPFSLGPDCEVTGGEEVKAGESRQFRSSVSQASNVNTHAASAAMDISVHPSGSSATLTFSMAESSSAGQWGSAWQAAAEMPERNTYEFVHLLVNNNTGGPIDLEVEWNLSAQARMNDNSFNCGGSKLAEAGAAVFAYGNHAVNAEQYCNDRWRLFEHAEGTPPPYDILASAALGGPVVLDATGNISDGTADSVTVRIERGRHFVYLMVHGRAQSRMGGCDNISAETSASGTVNVRLKRP